VIPGKIQSEFMEEHTESNTLQSILTQTEDMLSAAQAQDWDNLVEIEKQRQRDLNDFFLSATYLTDPQRAMIESIIVLDKQTSELAGAGRDELAASMKSMSDGQQASQLYKNVHRIR
jgi:hypothetical protein